VEEAVRSLHRHFFQDPDPEIFDVDAREPLADVSAPTAVAAKRS
jgi:hypothetical protein